MKNLITSWLLLLIVSVFFSSCVEDKCTRTYTLYYPVYKSKADVRANIKSNAPRPVKQPGKLFIRGNYIFLNEIDRGVHIIDNTNPSAPRNVAFIDIPGNLDIAVKGNTLYADEFADLVTIDITDPLQAKAKNFTDKVFPYRLYANGFVADTTLLIVDWTRKDTTVFLDCDNGRTLPGCDSCRFSTMQAVASSAGKNSSPFGAGGSMARFGIMNNHLYTVTNSDLKVFDISAPNDPVFTNKVPIGWDIETIFPFKDKLFVGSMTGMFIFHTQNPALPVKVGQFSHVRSCDPVIADDVNAYVTLRTGTPCAGFANQLAVLNITDITRPSLLRSYELTNPFGLSKDGTTLFVCDGKDGLKVYNAADPQNLILLKHVKGLETFDVIADNKLALVVAKDGLYQFDYTYPDDLRLLSKMGY